MVGAFSVWPASSVPGYTKSACAKCADTVAREQYTVCALASLLHLS